MSGDQCRKQRKQRLLICPGGCLRCEGKTILNWDRRKQNNCLYPALREKRKRLVRWMLSIFHFIWTTLGSDASCKPKSPLSVARFSTQWFSCFFLFGSPHQPVAKSRILVLFFKNCCAEKNPKHAVSFLFCSSRIATPLLCRVLSHPHCPPAPRRRQLPAPGKGCGPRLHRLAPLPCSKAEVYGFCTFQTQFLSLVSVRNLPDEGQLNHQLSPPTSRIFINIDLNS